MVFGSHQAVDVAVAVVESAEEGWTGEVGSGGVMEVVSRLRAATSDSVAIAVFRAERGAIPRTSSGKVRRRALWSALLDGASGGTAVYFAPDREGRIEPPWPVPESAEEAAK